MRGAVVGPDVCLELDDPARSTARRVVPDEVCPEQRPRGFDGRRGEERPVDDGQPR